MDDGFCDLVSIRSSKLYKIGNILKNVKHQMLNQNISLDQCIYFSGRVETQAK